MDKLLIRLLPLLIGASRQILMGALWALGSAGIEYLISLHKKGINVLARINLLFHPSVTRIAVFSSALLNIAGLCTALGSATGALHGVFKEQATPIAGGLILTGIVCTQIAGWGRSTITAVDSNVQP